MPRYLESLESRTFLSTTPTTLEAEAAARLGAVADNDIRGYTGTGYADFSNASGDWLEWNVNPSAAATRTLTFRYANGGGDRPLELRVSGQVVNAPMSFPNTGSWSTWKTITATMPFMAGTNRVRLTSIGHNGPNIDALSVSGTVTEPTPAERLRQAVDFTAQQLRRTAAEVPTSTYVNYTLNDGRWHVMDRIAWESGFLPASMWQMYERSGDTYWRDQAAARTTPLEVSTGKPYDTSFIICKPFKPLYDQTNDPQYRQTMLDAAAAKAAHFHETAGLFQGRDRASTSGDPRAQVGTYVDLMADLELFIWAAKETGNAQWLAMANRHAHQTADHLIRPDGSTIQWGYFDPATGDFVAPSSTRATTSTAPGPAVRPGPSTATPWPTASSATRASWRWPRKPPTGTSHTCRPTRSPTGTSTTRGSQHVSRQLRRRHRRLRPPGFSEATGKHPRRRPLPRRRRRGHAAVAVEQRVSVGRHPRPQHPPPRRAQRPKKRRQQRRPGRRRLLLPGGDRSVLSIAGLSSACGGKGGAVRVRRTRIVRPFGTLEQLLPSAASS